MSTRTVFKPFPVIVNGDMANDITSAVTVLQSITAVSYSLSWSGSTPIGTAEIQLSNDYSLNPDGSVDNAGTWVTGELSLAGAPVSSIPITGNTGTAFIDVEQTAAYAIRLFFNSASGTGTMQATIMGKVA